MTNRPQTRFARNGDVHLAYQVIGEGSVDLLVVDSWVHHVEMVWEIPGYAELLRRLGSFSRLIHFDRRGTGLSDPVPVEHLPDLDTQIADALTVLEAAGAQQPAIFGIQEGTLVAMLLAASHPQNCRALALYSGSVGGHGWPPEQIDQMADLLARDLAESGGAALVPMMAPSRISDPRFVEQFTRLQRASVRPGVVGHYFRQSMLAEFRHFLPSIEAPTLFLHRREDQVVPLVLAQAAADLIPGARLVELSGEDHLIFAGDTDELVDEIEEFLTGVRGSGASERLLANLLFTDIVDSTRTAAELGDRRWRALLDEHDRVIRGQLDRFGGQEVDTTGDGFLANFDGPGRAVRCARALAEAIASLGIQIRAGVHTGEVDRRGSNVGGLAVHIAARIAALAGPSEVLVSGTVKDLLVGSGFEFEDRDEHQLKGVPGSWRVYAVRPPGPTR
ncbi:MAG TPA: adenylate/guanylate cyclase domain-containing protein [Acidimicrobiia bacterium]|nr:adenylate/guanylate cyclase domain-containing protein [Acidimicrobiia bacterium]